MQTFPFWPDWGIEDYQKDKIGEGSYGVVYRIHKIGAVNMTDALKIIRIPKNQAEINELRYNGYDTEQIRKHYEKAKEQFINELKLQYQLGASDHIVSINDYHYQPQEGGVGYEFYIRMPFLTTLDQYYLDHYSLQSPMPQREVIRLGVEICEALTACEEKRIVHRDVKPANVFVNEYGSFLLGDFGIAKQLETSDSSMHTHSYTPRYAAPEVYAGKGSYDRTVDIYSLGIMLYQYSNHNRFPFEPGFSEQTNLSKTQVDKALFRRYAGEPVPAPDHAGPALSAVICKAIEADPQKRYRHAADMRAALLECLKADGIEEGMAGEDDTFSVFSKSGAAGRSASGMSAQELLKKRLAEEQELLEKQKREQEERRQREERQREERRRRQEELAREKRIQEQEAEASARKKRFLLLLAAAAVVVALIAAVFLRGNKPDQETAAGPSGEEMTGEVPGQEEAEEASEEEKIPETTTEMTTEATTEEVTEEPAGDTGEEGDDDAVVSVEPPEPEYDRIRMSHVSRITASSELSEYGMTHFAKRIADGDRATAWCEGAKGYGIGESVTLTFDDVYAVEGMDICAGYHAGQDLFDKNSRPKEILVEGGDKAKRFTLQDTMTWQTVDFGETWNTDRITITILSVYPGWKYEDTLISEVSLF